MCLLLYIATDAPVRLGAFGNLTVEQVKPGVLDALRSVFSKPSMRYVGVEGSCSCDFRHVIAEELFSYYDGMFDDEDDEQRAQADAVMADLLRLVQDHVQDGVELYATWADEHVRTSKGCETLSACTVRAERFFFVERYLYRLHA